MRRVWELWWTSSYSELQTYCNHWPRTQKLEKTTINQACTLIIPNSLCQMHRKLYAAEVHFFVSEVLAGLVLVLYLAPRGLHETTSAHDARIRCSFLRSYPKIHCGSSILTDINTRYGLRRILRSEFIPFRNPWRKSNRAVCLRLWRTGFVNLRHNRASSCTIFLARSANLFQSILRRKILKCIWCQRMADVSWFYTSKFK